MPDCAYFGRLYFSLTVVPLSSAKIVTTQMIALAVFGTAPGIVDLADKDAPTPIFIMALGSGVAAVIGFLVARFVMKAERDEVRQRRAVRT